MKLKTVHTSLTPIACHILKGRLESEGISCFIYDENIVWVHPFRAVAVGGVKLKVPEDQLELALKIISNIEGGQLCDENGDYAITELFENEVKRQNEILKVKSRIRRDVSLLNEPSRLAVVGMISEEMNELLESERKFQLFENKRFMFSWEEFLYELFDFDRSVIAYFRIRPVDFYLEKELVENFTKKENEATRVFCPQCHSDNTKHGYAIDFKWDIFYLIISVLFSSPFPLFRKKYHCFNCGSDFKGRESGNN